MESFFFPRKGSSQQKRTVEYIQLNIQSTDIQDKKMFEIGVLEFYHLHEIAKYKLKVLAGLDHVVHCLKIIWKRLPCVTVLFISFHKVKF